MELEILPDLGLELLNSIHNIKQYTPVTNSPGSGYRLCIVSYIDLKWNNNGDDELEVNTGIVSYIDLKWNNNIRERLGASDRIVSYIDLKWNNNFFSTPLSNTGIVSYIDLKWNNNRMCEIATDSLL